MLKQMYKPFFLSISLVVFMSCGPAPSEKGPEKSLVDMPVIDIDIQGHRGARGLMPENSIPGFFSYF